ncbi:MAG: site-specific integrase [Deltaproteobacteria bacterium]|jgi:integrase|nr:site-specific integrase [Deltaproteobacteria bacterium]
MACIVKRRERWVIDFYDHSGKRRWKTLPKGTTKAKAREELRVIEDLVGKGLYLPIKKIPLFSQVAMDWLEYKRPNIRETTWEVCEGHIRNHFAELDILKINRITTATIEKYITTRQIQGMNINTLRKVLVTLGQILSYAVRHKYTDHSPLKDAERPRSTGKEGFQEQEKIKVLTPPQIKAFLSKAKNQKHKALFMLALFSGARQGELLGLKWSDIDWNQRQIHIQRTFNNGHFFTTKTRSSNRKVDLGPNVITTLKEWKLGCPANDLDLVFPNEAGNPMDHNNLIKRHYEPALKAAKLPNMRFHDLRHTYASLLINQGENIKYIQSQLGHSSPSVTLNVYAHLMKPSNQQSACRLENTIFGEK